MLVCLSGFQFNLYACPVDPWLRRGIADEFSFARFHFENFRSPMECGVESTKLRIASSLLQTDTVTYSDLRRSACRPNEISESFSLSCLRILITKSKNCKVYHLLSGR